MKRVGQALIALTAMLVACGPANKKIVVEDFAEGRVVDLSITEKVSGNQDLLFVSLPKKTKFLEGYIQGIITDYADNPVQGVVVRAVVSADAQLEEGALPNENMPVSSFDPGVSDTNGFYRIRFTLPILDNIVDVRGKLLYNPGWEQEREMLGKAYEPQTKQSQFRLYYERKLGRITFVEGIRKSIVAPVVGRRAAASIPGAKAPDDKAAASGDVKPAGDEKKDDELFKGFGF